VNSIRRTQPALQHNDTLRFHLTTSDDLIAYSKVSPDGTTRIFTLVSLNPRATRDGWVCLALEDAPVPGGVSYPVRDLLTDRTYTWTGAWNYVRLGPDLPAHIFHIAI
jgi:starch synthase (maltosyl-transferring)